MEREGRILMPEAQISPNTVTNGSKAPIIVEAESYVIHEGVAEEINSVGAQEDTEKIVGLDQVDVKSEDDIVEDQGKDDDSDPKEEEFKNNSEDTESDEKNPEEEAKYANTQEKVSELEDRVEALAKENKALKQKVANIENRQFVAITDAYELAMLLKKILEDERRKKENQPVLVILARLIASLITMMLVDEDKRRTSNIEKQAA